MVSRSFALQRKKIMIADTCSRKKNSLIIIWHYDITWSSNISAAGARSSVADPDPGSDTYLTDPGWVKNPDPEWTLARQTIFDTVQADLVYLSKWEYWYNHDSVLFTTVIRHTLLFPGVLQPLRPFFLVRTFIIQHFFSCHRSDCIVFVLAVKWSK